MKKLNITKKQFGESKYFTDKYGKLEYVSESGQLYKTSKGKILKFKESKELVNEDAVDDDLKLLDQYCSGIRGNLNDSTDPDGLSIKGRIANFIGWKDSKSKGKFDNNNDLVTEGAGAGYDISFDGLRIDKVLSFKKSNESSRYKEEVEYDFVASLKPGNVDVECYDYYNQIIPSPYYDDVEYDFHIDGGKVYGTFSVWMGSGGNEEDAVQEMLDEIQGYELGKTSVMYGAGWVHSDLPEDGHMEFSDKYNHLRCENVERGTLPAYIEKIEIDSIQIANAINDGFKDSGDEDDDEQIDEQIDESIDDNEDAEETNKYGVPYQDYRLTFASKRKMIIDIGIEEEWGDINEYMDDKDEEFYVGYGNDEDGYKKIIKVEDPDGNVWVGKDEVKRWAEEKVWIYVNQYSG